VLVGFGDAGGTVGEGSKGSVDCGVETGECFGEGNSTARLLLPFTLLLSLALFSFVSSSGVGDGAVFAFVLLFAFAVGAGPATPPSGIPCSLCPVGGATGLTA